MQRKVLLYAGAILALLIFSAALVNAEDETNSEEENPDKSCEGDDCDDQSTTQAASTVITTAATTKAKTTQNPVKTTKWHKAGSCFVQIRNREDDDQDDTKKSPSKSINLWLMNGNSWYGPINSKITGKKRSRKGRYLRVKCPIPIHHYPNYNMFPAQRFPTLIAISPWLPIFYDRSTYQTIIYSQSGGLYVLPPVINFYGQRFSVAQLIQWGYASLTSTGASPQPNVDVSGLVHPQSATNDGVSATGGSGLYYDEQKAQFTGGVQTNFLNVKPRYSDVIY